MRIIVDAFGGDNAPLEIIKGCAMAVERYTIEILLCGDEEKLKKIAADNNISLSGMEILHAPDVILMEDHPDEIMKSKKNSSLAVALRALSEGKGDGFTGAGSTGATLMGATLIVKRIKGIKRPALAPILPKAVGKFMLIDCGANMDCRPEMLGQFAVMGSAYMKNVEKYQNPRVALANVGTEDTKGDALRKEVFSILRDEKSINFIGNIEARDIPKDAAEVIVTDGFTGNVILKLYEGVAGELMGKIKGLFSKSLKNKIAAAAVLRDMKTLKNELDYNKYGGAPFIGVQKPVIKAHGSSKAETFCIAIGQTKQFIEANVIEEITKVC